jgi:hypothetical protein
MDLSDAIRSIIIEDLKRVDLLVLDRYARQNQTVLHALYDHKIIDEPLIEGALEEAVFLQARHDYETMTRKGRPDRLFADHLGRPSCLAYALERNKFSEAEIAQIPFDHGQNASSYAKQFRQPDLLPRLREELLHPKPLSRFD